MVLNDSTPICVLVPYCEFFVPYYLSILAFVGDGALLWEVFTQIHFFQEELYPPLYPFLWVKLV